MRNRTAAALPILLAVLTAACIPGSFKPTSPDPVMTLDRDKHDFGPVPATDTVQTVFTVRNDGAKDLEVSRVQTSCGCTAAMMDSQSLKPGASSRLKVTFDPRGRNGRQARTIWLYSNDPKNPQKQLVIIADIAGGAPKQEPDIQAVPSSSTVIAPSAPASSTTTAPAAAPAN